MDTDTDQVPQYGADIRQEFMLKDDVIFLNHGSFGAVPRCVHRRQVRHLEELESHTDLWYRFKVPEYLKAAVKKVAWFIGTEPRDTFLIQNVTKAVNTVLKTYPLQPGDAIFITNQTYSAVKVIAQTVTSKIKGAKTHILDIHFPIKSEEEIVELYDHFLRNNPDIKLAVIDHITSPTAAVLPVKRLVELCHQHDVIVMIDGAHAPGTLDLDLQDIDADFYTGNIHKWVYTPRSCAVLWMNPRRHHSWFKPLVTSWYENESLQMAFSEEGTKDDTAYLCAMDGIDYYNRIGGRENILKYTSTLKEDGVAYLERAWQTERLEIPASMSSPNMQMIRLPAMPKYQHLSSLELLMLFVERFGIQIYVSASDPRLIRVSVQVYNTMEDFFKLANAVTVLASER